MSLPPPPQQQRRLPLDPFPGFSTCSLDFPLDHIDQLYDYQLALVAFHPDATLQHKTEAELLFWRRRVARKAADAAVDDGLVELDAGRRQLQRARDWLEGKAPSSRPMKDAQVQAGRPPSKDAEVSTRRRPPPVPCSAAADDDLQPIQSSSAAAAVTPTSALPQAPTSSRSHDPDAPPGPFFSAFHDGGASLPPAPKTLPLLIKQLRVLWVGGFPKEATRALFLAFIKRAGSQKFPRPLAISKISAATYAVAFRTRSQVQLAQRLLHNVALPKMKCKLSAAPGGWRPFKWSNLSDEVRGAWLRTGSLPFDRPVFVEMAPAPFKVCVSKEYQAEFDRITRALAMLSSAAEEAARATTDARSPPAEADPPPCTAAPSAVSLPPTPTTSANNPSEIAPVLRKSPAAAPPITSATLVAQATTTTSSTSAATILAQAESAPKPPSGLLQRAGQGSGSAAAATEGNAASASSSSSEIATLPSAAPRAPRPGPRPSVAALPTKPIAQVAPLPPRPLSNASLPARPSAANVPQASAPPALRLPAPPIATSSSKGPAPPSAPCPGGVTSSSSIDDIFRLPSSATATATATASAASDRQGTPLPPPPAPTFQSAYDDGHDFSSCPCCPPRPPDLHLWTPQRLASVLLNERHHRGEEAFQHLATSFRAYVQAFGCEALRIRAEKMPWYRKRSPRAGAAAAAAGAPPPPATTMTTTTTTMMAAGVVRPPPASAQVSTDPRKRPRLA